MLKKPGAVFAVIVLQALFLAVMPYNAHAGEYFIEKWGCFLDLPQGITPLEVTDESAAFSDESGRIFFQIRIYPPERYDSAASIHSDIKSRLKAQGDGLSFAYNGMDAIFADYSFAAGSEPVRGYGFLLNGDRHDWVVLSFCDSEIYEKYHFFLLSALDSFSINENALFSPGPVSLFYENSFADTAPVAILLDFEGKKIAEKTSAHRIEAAEVAAEREANVLSFFKPSDTDAWSRFYRMIYRDNFSSLVNISEKMGAILAGLPPQEKASRLLSWFQGFSYSRSGTLADFSPPLTTLKDKSGDCDSLGLLYIIMLRYLGIDSILMVSSEYSHSMAAVDIPGKGARFSHKNRQYLVAEMTRSVSIGMIDAAMADPAKWLGIEFKWHK